MRCARVKEPDSPGSAFSAQASLGLSGPNAMRLRTWRAGFVQSLKRNPALEIDGWEPSLAAANRAKSYFAVRTHRAYSLLCQGGWRRRGSPVSRPSATRLRRLAGSEEAAARPKLARRIEDAIANSDFFIACFSTRSVKKRGGFQAEIRFAWIARGACRWTKSS